jgi:hypothetical protein
MIVSSFIIQANVITIVTYDRKTFIVQATGNTKEGSITVLLASCLTGLVGLVCFANKNKNCQ